MPAPIHYSHKILRLMAEDRKSGKLKNIEPDSKSQVTFEYVDGKPSKVKSVVISSQHSADVNQAQVRDLLRPYMLKSIPENFIKDFKLLPVPEIKTAVFIFLEPVNRAI